MWLIALALFLNTGSTEICKNYDYLASQEIKDFCLGMGSKRCPATCASIMTEFAVYTPCSSLDMPWFPDACPESCPNSPVKCQRGVKCEEVAGLGTAIKDFKTKCRALLEVAEERIFPEECDVICQEDEECTHVAATQIDMMNPGMIQCFTAACDNDGIEFVPRGQTDPEVVWKQCREGEAAPVTLEPSDAVVPTETTVTCGCDEVNELIASGECMLPTEAEVTMQPTTAAPTREMLWEVEGADRCPLAYKLGIWGHFGKPKNAKKCEKKCRSHPDCVAISYKTDNRACTGFSSCPFFESTDTFGGNEGWINIRVKPEPSTSAFSTSFAVEKESWTALRAGERAFACLGLLAAAVLGQKALCSSKADDIYLQVEHDL